MTIKKNKATVTPEAGGPGLGRALVGGASGFHYITGPPEDPPPHIPRAAVFSWHRFPPLSTPRGHLSVTQMLKLLNLKVRLKGPRGTGHTCASSWETWPTWLFYLVFFQLYSSWWEMVRCVSVRDIRCPAKGGLKFIMVRRTFGCL